MNDCVKTVQQKQPPEVFHKKGSLENFAKFTGKHLCQSFLFNKVAGRVPLNFAKFLGTPFLQNTSGQLFLIRYTSKTYNLRKWVQKKCRKKY